jgi:hypothetical protein
MCYNTFYSLYPTPNVRRDTKWFVLMGMCGYVFHSFSVGLLTTWKMLPYMVL